MSDFDESKIQRDDVGKFSATGGADKQSAAKTIAGAARGRQQQAFAKLSGAKRTLGHLSVADLKKRYDDAAARTNSGMKPDDDWKAVTKELKARKLGTFQKLADALHAEAKK